MSPAKPPSLQQLRRYAIARSLFKPTSLPRAMARLGFVQADPMRAPARAQDLILAQRVKNYRAGELERRYPRLAIEEAFFINYGFLPRETLALLHPRGLPRCLGRRMQARAHEVLDFVRQHGRTHPKDVQAHFDHGRIKRWGGDLNVSTHLLEGLHYRGLLRVVRRESGTRVYQAIEYPPQDDTPEARLARAGQLLDMVVQLYAPLPARSLGYLCALLRYGVPQLAAEIRQVQKHAESRYAHAQSRRRAVVLAAGREARGRPATGSTTSCASSRPSIPWSGTGGASSCSGAGSTSSKPMCRRTSAAWAITRCPCYGASKCWAGRI